MGRIVAAVPPINRMAPRALNTMSKPTPGNSWSWVSHVGRTIKSMKRINTMSSKITAIHTPENGSEKRAKLRIGVKKPGITVNGFLLPVLVTSQSPIKLAEIKKTPLSNTDASNDGGKATDLDITARSNLPASATKIKLKIPAKESKK